MRKNCLKKYLNLKTGQSMIEVVIGLAITTMLAVALVATSIFTQKASRSAKNETQASKLAQQLIEQMRVYRDRVPSGFTTIPSSGCYTLNAPANADPVSWTFSSSFTCPTIPLSSFPVTGAESIPLAISGGDSITFNRWAQFSLPSATKKGVKVFVTWTDSSGIQMATNETILSNWCAGSVVPGGPCTAP